MIPTNGYFTSKTSRYAWIDILRGLAIMLMIPANYIALLEKPYNLIFRVIISNVAPIFIILSVGMVVLNAKNHNFLYYLQRGLYISIISGLIDILIRNIMPFHSFDVLYIIGIGLPIAYLIKNWNQKILLILSIFFFIISCILQNYYGYENNVLEVSLFAKKFASLKQISYSFFINGWFPIFPWLGYVFYGVAIFKYLFSTEQQQKNKFFLIFMCLIVTCMCYFLLFHKFDWIPKFINTWNLNTRHGLAEIFYPPSFIYLLSTISVFVVLVHFVQLISDFRCLNFLKKFGQYSMFLYILHDAAYFLLILNIFDFINLDIIRTWQVYCFIITIVLCIMYMICILIDKLKNHWQPKNLFVKLIIG